MPMERIDRSVPGVSLPPIAPARLLLCLNRYAPLAHLRRPVAEAAGPSPRIDSDVALLTSADQNMVDPRDLAEPWYRRTQGSALSDYPIGLGDVLETVVPAAAELKNRSVFLLHVPHRGRHFRARALR